MTQIIRGRKRKPLAIVAYGVPGVGKSTFAAGAPNPIFLGPEENDELDVARFPIVKKYDQLIGYFDELIRGDHKKEKFETVVLDSIDAVEKLIHKEICDREPGKTMATACKGFGKAYIEAGQKLWKIREKLEVLRDQGHYNIIVLGHAVKTKFEDPVIASSYDVWEMALHKTKAQDFNAFFTEWASTVLFMNWKNYKSEDEKFAFSLGRREIMTEFRPSYVAKNRFNLPHQIEMDSQNPLNTFKILEGYINEFFNSGATASYDPIPELVQEVKGLLAKTKDEFKQQHGPAIEQAIQNPVKEQLEVYKGRLNEIVQNQ